MAGTLHHGARFRFDLQRVDETAAIYRVTIELPEDGSRLGDMVIPLEGKTVPVPEFDGPVEAWMADRVRVLGLKVARPGRKDGSWPRKLRQWANHS